MRITIVLLFLSGSLFVSGQVNVALNKPVTASSESPFGGPYYAEYAVDGDNNTIWQSSFESNPEIIIDLEAYYFIDEIVLNSYGVMEAFQIEFWNGYEWEVLASVSGNGDDPWEYAFSSVVASQVKLVAGVTLAKVVELEVYGVPSYGIPTPAKISAEGYSAMDGVHEAYMGGTEYFVEDIGNGDWVEYDVNMTNSGLHTITFRVASESQDIAFDLSSDGLLLDQIVTSTTGHGRLWREHSIVLNLNSGSQTIRITGSASNWNLDWFEIIEGEVMPPEYPGVGDVLQAENFAAGSGIRVDMGENPYVYSFHANDWVEYQINIPEDGDYNLKLRLKEGTFNADLSDENGLIANLDTTLEDYFNTYKFTVPLTEGNHSLRLTSQSAAWDMDWLLLDEVMPEWQEKNGNLVVNDQIHVGIKEESPDYPLEVNGSINALNYVQNGVPFQPGWASSVVGISTSKRVGIGTSNPDEALTVNGTILSKEVIIDLGVDGPDYVFYSNYELMSLNDLSQYIKLHKHLPHFPPADQMKEDGVDIGTNQINLLRTIEELMLHQIELRKELDELDEH